MFDLISELGKVRAANMGVKTPRRKSVLKLKPNLKVDPPTAPVSGSEQFGGVFD